MKSDFKFKHAQEKCAEEGARLASVVDNETNIFIQNFTTEVLLGGRRLGWKWSDETDLFYSNFENNDKTKKSGNCLKMNHQSGKWEGADCNSKMGGVVCQTQRTAVTERQLNNGCPKNDSIQFGNMCYQYIEDDLDWQNSRKTCQQRNGRMKDIVKIDSSGLNIDIRNAVTKDVWIGGRVPWVWKDGPTWNFTNWSPGQKDDNNNNWNKNCIIMTQYGKWERRSCKDFREFLCQQNIESREKISKSAKKITITAIILVFVAMVGVATIAILLFKRRAAAIERKTTMDSNADYGEHNEENYDDNVEYNVGDNAMIDQNIYYEE